MAINKEEIKLFFLDKFTVKMRSGGISNKNLQNILIKMHEDFKIIAKFNPKQIENKVLF